MVIGQPSAILFNALLICTKFGPSQLSLLTVRWGYKSIPGLIGAAGRCVISVREFQCSIQYCPSGDESEGCKSRPLNSFPDNIVEYKPAGIDCLISILI